MVLVLSVIKLLVTTVEGNDLISILLGCSLAMFFVQGITGFACADGLCLLLGSLWAVLHRWQKQQSQFTSAGAMTNALPEQNSRAGFGRKLYGIG